MIIATLCHSDGKFEQVFLCLSECQGSIFPSKHYCLSCVNMLGLFLTTTGGANGAKIPGILGRGAPKELNYKKYML